MSLLAAALCLSCRKNPQGGEDNSIRLAVDDRKSLITDVSQMRVDGSTFMLNAKFSQGSTFNPATAETLFKNQEVEYSAGYWTYSPTQFWAKNRTYRFRALWPETALVTGFSDDLAGNVTLTYTTPSKIDEQIDLMLSSLTARTTTSDVSTPQPTVNLQFSHLLSNINVKLKKITPEGGEDPDPDAFEITSAQMIGMKNKGTYTSGAWDVSAGTVLTCSYTHATNTLLADDGSPTKAFGADGLLLIPQTWAEGDVNLVLNYKVTHNGLTKTKSATIHLPVSPAWEAGKYYNYILTLSESYDIIFSTPGVESWGSSLSSGTVIIQ